MFLLVSHYPDFFITSCVHAFENYVQSILLYGRRSVLTGGPLFLVKLPNLKKNEIICHGPIKTFFMVKFEVAFVSYFSLPFIIPLIYPLPNCIFFEKIWSNAESVNETSTRVHLEKKEWPENTRVSVCIMK